MIKSNLSTINNYKPSIFQLVVCLLVFIPIISFGQSTVALLNLELNHESNDTTKLSAYEKIIRYYETKDHDSAIYYSKQGVAYFKKDNFKYGEAKMLHLLSACYANEGFIDPAKKYGEEALKIFTDLKDDAGIGLSNNVLGVIEGKQANYLEATKYFISSLSIFEKLKDTEKIVNTYIKLGTVNTHTNNIDKGLSYNFKALKMLDSNKVTQNLVFIYNNIGCLYCMKNDFEQAKIYFKKVINQSNNDEFSATSVLAFTNMGIICQKEHNASEAIEYFNKGINITTKLKMNEERASLLNNLASVYEFNNPQKSLSLLTEALNITKTIGQKQLQILILQSMVSVYKNIGNYKNALLLYEQQKILSDSVFNIEKDQAIANLETKHDIENSEAKIKQLEISEKGETKAKNLITIVSILLSIFLLILLYFVWKLQKLIAKIRLREAELEKSNLIKNRLFSILGHDLIGPIGSIPAVLEIIRENGSNNEENGFLLELLEKNSISCYETLENLLNWGKSLILGVIIKQIKFNASETAANEIRLIGNAAISKSIKIENNINKELYVFADPNHYKFVIRNLLSNAVKYSFENTHVLLNARIDDIGSEIIFSVTDFGVGISEGKRLTIFSTFGESTVGTENEKGNGIGLKLCKEFITENGGKIWVESIPNKGSTFYFTLKLAA